MGVPLIPPSPSKQVNSSSMARKQILVVVVWQVLIAIKCKMIAAYFEMPCVFVGVVIFNLI